MFKSTIIKSFQMGQFSVRPIIGGHPTSSYQWTPYLIQNIDSFTEQPSRITPGSFNLWHNMIKQSAENRQWYRETAYDITKHYDDVIMSPIVSQITSLMIVYSTVYSGVDQRKHESSMSLAYVRGIHRGLVNSPHKWPVTWKMFPFDDIIMKAMRLMVDETVCFEMMSLMILTNKTDCRQLEFNR